MNKNIDKRVAGIDILKTCAVFFVICVHFSLKTYYYKTPIESGSMVFQSYLRWIFATAVPLFLLCTGYLERKKEVSASYYKKIFRVLIPYTLISIICIIINTTIFGKELTFKDGLLSIFTFSADSYAWYVEMYIGLFFLIPIFNTAVNSLSKKQLLTVILSLVFVISLPSTVNPLLDLLTDYKYFYFPDWWKAIYPLIYYFIGAYISKHRPVIRKSVCLSVVLIMPALQTLLQMYLNTVKINNMRFTNYGSLFIIIESTFIFLLLYTVDIKFSFPKKVFKKISTLTLETYLLSNLTDKFVYNFLKANYFTVGEKMSQEEVFGKFFLIAVPVTFLSALLGAIIFNSMYKKAEKLVMLIVRKIQRKPKPDGKNKDTLPEAETVQTVN